MPIKIRWSGQGDLKVPIPYDTDRFIIVDDIMDFAIHLQVHELWSFSYVKNEMYHLIVYLNYLGSNRISVENAVNDTLRDFRDSDFIRLGKASRASEKKIKRVINSRLTLVYSFYHWYQGRHVVLDLIGAEGCAITSDFSLRSKRNKSSHDCYRMFPLCHRRIGRSSQHATEYSATEDDIDSLEGHFRKGCNEYISERNSLMMAIASSVGFRRGSLNSLRCSQFSNEELAKSMDDYLIVNPDKQKFDANINYRIPILLAYRISEFINTVRKNMVIAKGFGDNVTLDRIFLSVRDGTPLHDASISDIFGQAFKSIGNLHSRTSIHSFRRKFAQDRIQANFEQRAELKLDTSDASVSAAVAMELGQRNADSIKPYVARTQQMLVNQRHQDKSQLIKKLMEENVLLKMQLDDLKSNIKIIP
jgi:hypothetical protein